LQLKGLKDKNLFFSEYYPNCEIQFMGLPNIHAIRKSFHGVRALCLLGQEQIK